MNFNKKGCANVNCNERGTLNLFEGKYYCLRHVSKLVKTRNELYDINLQEALNKKEVEIKNEM